MQCMNNMTFRLRDEPTSAMTAVCLIYLFNRSSQAISHSSEGYSLAQCSALIPTRSDIKPRMAEQLFESSATGHQALSFMSMWSTIQLRSLRVNGQVPGHAMYLKGRRISG